MSTLHRKMSEYKNENMENNLITIVISEYNPNLILFLREQLVKIGFKFISAVYDPIKDEHYFNMEKPIQNEG